MCASNMGSQAVMSLLPSRLWSEGPTPSALQEVLDKLDEHTEQARADLFFGILKNISQGSPDTNTLAALSSLEVISSSSGTEQWVAQCANDYLKMQKHVASLQAELKAAQAAADLEATLNEFRTYLENGQFNEATYNLVQLKKVLEDSKGGGNTHNPELQQLQEAVRTCAGDLDEALESSFNEAFDAVPDHGLITITCSLPSGGDVGNLWEALERAELEDKHLNTVADTLLQHVLPCVVNGTAYLNPHISPDLGSAQIAWGPAQPQPDGSFSTQHVEQYCAQLLSVLAQALFRQRPSTLAKFGKLFWARFVQLYQEAFLQQVQGTSAAVLQARQESAKQMEQQAVATGLAEPGSDLASCLIRAIQQSYHIVQEQYLAEARDLLLSHDPHAEPVTVGQPLPLDTNFYQNYKQGKVKAWELLDPPAGWDVKGPVLATGYYQVSNTVLQLVMIMDDALASACHQGDSSVAQAVIGAVSKMAAMFNTMLATPAAADAPVLVLQRHNDLQYLAAHLLMLPFLFGEELHTVLGTKVWFGDDALRLRNSARSAYNDMLSVQAAAVRDALAPVLGLSASLQSGKHTLAKEAQSAASSAQNGALYTLRRVGKLWWSCLAPGVALEASKQLLDELAGTLVHDILARKDIGETEAAELVKLYRPILAGCVPELLGDVDLSNQATVKDEVQINELVAAALHQQCSSLRKLDAVLGLLEARLADIAAAWESGALQAAGLSMREVEHMVLALFEDTDYRAQCLQRMEAAEIH